MSPRDGVSAQAVDRAGVQHPHGLRLCLARTCTAQRCPSTVTPRQWPLFFHYGLFPPCPAVLDHAGCSTHRTVPGHSQGIQPHLATSSGTHSPSLLLIERKTPKHSPQNQELLINRVTHLFPTMWGLVGCTDRSYQCQGALLSPGSGHGHRLVTPRSPCDDRVRRASAAATACRWGTPTSSFTLSLTGTASRAPQSCASNCAARARPRTSPSSWWGTKPTWCGAVRCLKKVSRG